MKLHERITARAKLVSRMREYIDRAGAQRRSMTADETASYESMESELAILNSLVANEQKLEAQVLLETDLATGPHMRCPPTGGHKNSRGGRYAKAFAQYARNGKAKSSSTVLNALQVGTSSEGGYLVPEEYESAIVTYLQQQEPIRARSTVIRTAADREIPVETDRGDFAYISEEGTYTEDDPVFGRVTLGSYKSGGIVKVSEELLSDALFDVEAYLTEAAGRRFANLEGTAFAAGDGSDKPTGLFATTAVAGVNLTGFEGGVSAVATITADDIFDTYHTLGMAYRLDAVWLGGSDITKMIRKLKDSTNQYVWEPGLKSGSPSTLLGRPYIETETAPAPTAGGKSLMFGDLRAYTIVDRIGMVAQRLDELYAAGGQVGFRFAKRLDAKLTDPKSFTFFQHGAGA